MENVIFFSYAQFFQYSTSVIISLSLSHFFFSLFDLMRLAKRIKCKKKNVENTEYQEYFSRDIFVRNK